MQARYLQLLRALVWCAVFVLAPLPLAAAEPMVVPAQLQATILQKIFSYDRTLERGAPKIVIVAADSADPQVSELKATLTRLGSAVDVTSAAAMPTQADGVSVVYIMPGQLTDAITRACAQHGILSVSGVPAWAEQGRVSVSIGLAAGKPEIIVNLTRSKAERHELSSRLLRLARVVP